MGGGGLAAGLRHHEEDGDEAAGFALAPDHEKWLWYRQSGLPRE